MNKKLTSVIKKIIKEETLELGLAGAAKRKVKAQIDELKKIERILNNVKERIGYSSQGDSLQSGLVHLLSAISSFSEYVKDSNKSDLEETDTKTEAVDSKSDKAVLEAFTDGSPLDGNKLSTDGITLNGHWMGGNSIAEWVPTKDGKKIKFNDLGSKVAQQIQKAIAKIAPSNWLLNGKGY